MKGAQVVEWLERMPYTQPTPVRIPIGGPLLHVTPPLSPMFPVGLLMNKGVYANKIFKKKKKFYFGLGLRHWEVVLSLSHIDGITISLSTWSP